MPSRVEVGEVLNIRPQSWSCLPNSTLSSVANSSSRKASLLQRKKVKSKVKDEAKALIEQE
jgi:hypothetical protein